MLNRRQSRQTANTNRNCKVGLFDRGDIHAERQEIPEPPLKSSLSTLQMNSGPATIFFFFLFSLEGWGGEEILATLPDDLDLSRIAEIADKINDVPSINSVDSPVPTDAAMMDVIEQLKQQLERLSTQVQHLTRPEDKNSYKVRRRSHSATRARRPTLCWYHLNFVPTFTQSITEGGKRRSQQHLKAASTVGTHITNRLFYIKNRNSNMSFLIDTGAQLSVVPPSLNFTKTNSSVTLRAANGTNIKTFGEQSLPLDIGLRRTYQWIFTVADVKFLILGADFLAHYQLIVDLSQRQLSDSTTKLSNRGIVSQLTSTELRIAVPRDNPIQDMLDKFPSLIQPFTYTKPVKHSTVHSIRTTEQPVYSKPRRLAPDKYKIARAEFQHMLDLGIIRPSSSPYASPLHMVTKAQQGAWRPASLCGSLQETEKIADEQVREIILLDSLRDSSLHIEHYPLPFTDKLIACDTSKKMSSLAFTPTRYTSRDVYVPPSLLECEYVFVRQDSVRKPLTPHYAGPFRVLARTDKYTLHYRLTTADRLSLSIA
ncbi:unnamed protein product [Acanthosepion pharaonis]|uniref:Peptidase A2 domain-containing protein n=1 Tax=Acanthosepion pharaonis TaxID=158019 RepID=A0A812BL94_ACAPH|nr:unnamed protein product [Sepia pharaonis]